MSASVGRSGALGLLPKRPERYAVALSIGDHLTGKVPAIPPSVDYLRGKGLTFGLYRNDSWPDCGPAALANYLRLVRFWLTGTMKAPTLDDVVALYKASGNPDFDPDRGRLGNGVVMQDMLDAAHAMSSWAGEKVICFAKVDVHDLGQVRAAVAIFGGVLLGLDLDEAQDAQTASGTWDYVPDSPDWGGHATLGGGYVDRPGTIADLLSNVTWEQLVDMTELFCEHQIGEAWVVVLESHLGTRAFLEGVNVASLASAYTALTGRPFPVVTPPIPVEPPSPVVPLDPVVPSAPPVAPAQMSPADRELLDFLGSRAGRQFLRMHHWLDAERATVTALRTWQRATIDKQDG